MKMVPIIGVSLLAPSIAFAQASQHYQTMSPYAGEETREIKSLSADDIAELRRGGGWGMAKAAELNGMPGPAHTLELVGRISLQPDQLSAIRGIFARMQEDAIGEGERLIARERVLGEQFRDRSITDESLRRMLAEIEESRRTLRYIHLAAHLETVALLSEEQIGRYQTLRGYRASP